MAENIPFPKYLQNKTQLDHKEKKKEERKKSNPNNIDQFLKNSPEYSVLLPIPSIFSCLLQNYIYLSEETSWSCWWKLNSGRPIPLSRCFVLSQCVPQESVCTLCQGKQSRVARLCSSAWEKKKKKKWPQTSWQLQMVRNKLATTLFPDSLCLVPASPDSCPELLWYLLSQWLEQRKENRRASDHTF